jgi:hypothetical protein
MRAANKCPSRRLASFLRRRLGALTSLILVPHGNSLAQAQATHELHLWVSHAKSLLHPLQIFVMRLLVPRVNSLHQVQAVPELRLWALRARLQHIYHSEHLVNLRQQNPLEALLIVRSGQPVKLRHRRISRAPSMIDSRRLIRHARENLRRKHPL